MRAPYIPSEHAVKGLNAEPSAWIKRFCPLFSPNAKVLDMACGAGRNTKLLASFGNQVTSLDLDERCRPYIEVIPGATFMQADLELRRLRKLIGTGFAQPNKCRSCRSAHCRSAAHPEPRSFLPGQYA